VVAGHGRLQAAKSLGMQLVPVVAISSLSEADKKALIIADNRIAELSNWDRDILAIEYQGLHDLQFDDLEITGFSLGEIDTILDEASEKKPVGPGPDDDLPPVVAAPVSRRGDLWILGSHRLLCGDARSESDYKDSFTPHNLTQQGGRNRRETIQMDFNQMDDDVRCAAT
jgi:ParB-like chromosome segregation protein Spo0J